jgi:hypothetical protein
MNMENKKQYPKMLYKADASKAEVQGFIQTNKRVGYTTVSSPSEEKEIKARGWVNHPNDAEHQLKNIDKIKAVKCFFLENWKFWITTSIAISGLVIAYIKLK